MNDDFYFISFSSYDGREHALRIAESMQVGDPQFPIWEYTGQVKPGEYWAHKVVEALKHCAGVVFVMTPDSVDTASECEKEWSRALKYQKRVIPLLFAPGIEPPLRLELAQHIDFTRDFHAAATQLRQHLEYCASPTGELDWLQFRLRLAERDLVRASDFTKPRISAEIEELRQSIARLQRIIRDPQGVVNEVDTSIRLGLQLERREDKPVARVTQTRFINAPPAVAPSYFQDRHIETGLVSSFLSEDALRLMTIVGRGGVGKTALICRLLKFVETGRFPEGIPKQEVDGIVYLSAVGSHRITLPNLFTDLVKLLPEAVADQVLQVYKNPNLSIERKVCALTEAFPNGRYVVLLDNFEDILDGDTRRMRDSELSEGLAALLSAPHHGIKVIITTRIPPRDLAFVQPARQTRLDLDQGLESPYAESILREMDRDGKVGLKHAPGDLLRRARTLTNGNPRALEALFAILSSDRETSLEDVLSDTAHLLPEAVVDALVGEAFARLDQNAQLVMQALAIFAQPVSPVAVDYVLQPYLPTTDSAPILNRLVNMHFVRMEGGAYYLHPIDAAYALSRIPEGRSDDRSQTPLPYTRFGMWHRAGDYFQEVTRQRDAWQSLKDLAPVFGQFEMRINCKDFNSAARALLAIDWDYLYPWGHYAMLITMHERLLAGDLSDGRSKTFSLTTLGTAYGKMLQHDLSIECFRKCIDVSRRVGDSGSEAAALNNLSLRYADLGRMDEAFECLKEAQEIEDRSGSDRNVHESLLRNLGTLYAFAGNTTLAIQRYDQALAYARQTFARDRESINLEKLGDVLTDLERWNEALESYSAALSIADEIRFVQVQSGGRRGLATLKLLLGDVDAARSAAAAALQFDVPENNCRVRVVSAIAALRDGDVATAKADFASVIQEADEILGKCRELVAAHEAKALALSGLVLCGELTMLPQAMAQFAQARSLCRAQGIVDRSLRLLGALAPVDTGNLLSVIRKAAAAG